MHSGNQNSAAWADNLPPCEGTAPAGKYEPLFAPALAGLCYRPQSTSKKSNNKIALNIHTGAAESAAA